MKCYELQDGERYKVGDISIYGDFITIIGKTLKIKLWGEQDKGPEIKNVGRWWD